MQRQPPPNARAASWDSAYRNAPAPWDIGRPQPVFVRLAEAGLIQSPVLDSGCGSGEQALFLASRGLEVVGVDIAPSAIAKAREKAAARGVSVTFLVGDVMELESLGRRFRTVIDSGVFHVFETTCEVTRYVASLHAVLEPEGMLHLMCFSDEEPGSWGPRRVPRDELRVAFADGWQIESIEPAAFEINAPSASARAWLVRCRRTSP
jgi:cyclopropane fatty-acyl-phospholipid synthase-like methyltransferase